MDMMLRKKSLLLRYPKPHSTHCWYDQDGWRGMCGVFFGRYHFTLRHRYSGKTALDVIVWHWEPGYSRLVRSWRDEVAKFVKRLSDADKGVHGHNAGVDEAMGADYPALHEHLTCDWLDGSRRVTSSLGISVDQGVWKGRLADRENGMVLFRSGDGFYGVLRALEDALVGDTADWREDQFAKPQGKGGKKKD